MCVRDFLWTYRVRWRESVRLNQICIRHIISGYHFFLFPIFISLYLTSYFDSNKHTQTQKMQNKTNKSQLFNMIDLIWNEWSIPELFNDIAISLHNVNRKHFVKLKHNQMDNYRLLSLTDRFFISLLAPSLNNHNFQKKHSDKS